MYRPNEPDTINYASVLQTAVLALILGLALSTPARAAPADRGLVLAVQPVLSEAKTQEAFEPLAKYLSKAIGEPVTLQTSPNFMAYWSEMLHDQSNMLYFDAAHFTDYRVEKFHYHVLVKVPGTVSYSLIVRDDKIVFDPSELTGKTIATLGAPSIGAARLSGMFPNPLRQPIMIDIPNAQAGVKMVVDGKTDAAIIPTPIVARAMSQGAHINVVTTTEPTPHIALSANPHIPKAIRNKIRRAMLTASQRPKGKIMLREIGFPKFDPANAAIYRGQDKILKTYWGF